MIVNVSVPSLRQLMSTITCFPSSGGGKAVPAQPSEEGPARKGKALEAHCHLEVQMKSL